MSDTIRNSFKPSLINIEISILLFSTEASEYLANENQPVKLKDDFIVIQQQGSLIGCFFITLLPFVPIDCRI